MRWFEQIWEDLTLPKPNFLEISMLMEKFLRQVYAIRWQILRSVFMTFLISLLGLANSEWAFAQNLLPENNTPVTSAASTIYVRENFYGWPQTKIDAFKKGVAEMKARPISDPTSWLYQANIHGVTSGNADLWNTCQHGSFFFLSWHRMYLYYFERILRAAAIKADPTLPTISLPYWNYSDIDAQRALPLAFRSPASSTNPIYEVNRSNTINQGGKLPLDSVSYTAALASTKFTGTVATGGFGGGAISAPSHSAGQTGLLESVPHNQVHVQVGGYMSQVNLAARDAIFWLHHANIDRLWESWIAKGNKNPDGSIASDQTFLNTTFYFFDENKNKVSLTGKEILNTVTQLGYRYDQLSPPLKLKASIPPSKLIEINDSPITQPVEPLTVVKAKTVAPKLPRTIVNIEGIEYDPSNVVPYNVYLNLPSGVEASSDSPYYAGTIALFSHPQGAAYSLDVTDTVSRLKSLNLLKDEKLAVTIVPPQPEKYLTTAQVKKLSSLKGGQNLVLDAATRESANIPVPKIRFQRITNSVVTE